MSEKVPEYTDFMDRLNAGDQAASDELFTRIYTRLLGLARMMLGSYPDLRRQHDAESFVHDGWIDLQTALRKTRPDSAQDYLRLAVHKVRQVLWDLSSKERGRRDRLSLTPNHDEDESTPNFDPSSGSSADPGRLELWTRFHEAVNGLPEDTREVFGLYFYAGLKQAEIAKLVGKSPKAVSRLVAEANMTLATRVSGLAEILS